MTNIRYQVGWRNMFVVPCKFIKKKGGKGVCSVSDIAIMWNEGTPVALNSYSDNHIDVLVGDVTDPKRWRFSGFYGYPRVGNRHLSWSLMKLLAQKSSLPWLMGEDFNEVLVNNEKMGGLRRCARQMSAFREALDFCSLVNIHAVGPQFTWRGIRGGEEIRVRLDRFIASTSWSEMFPASRAVNLKPNKSDHLPILYEIRDFSPRKKRKKKKFCFEDSWLLNEECKRCVEDGWNCAAGDEPFSTICFKISNTRQALMN